MLLLVIAAVHSLSLQNAPPVITCDMAEHSVRAYCRNAGYGEYEFYCEEDERGLYLFDSSCEED